MKAKRNNGTTRVWADRSITHLLLPIMTTAFSFTAVMDGSGHWWGELLLVALVIIASLRAGASGGLVVGLAGAAGHIALCNIDGDWGHRSASFSVVTVCTFIAYGWLFGLATAHLRRQQAADASAPAAAGAGGSQGLLTAEEGRALLEVEAQQARLAGSRLAVLTVKASAVEGIRPKAAALAFRAMARSFEASASGLMNPVLLAEDQLAMVIPGGPPQDANNFKRALVRAMAEATYADREAGARVKASTALRLDTRYVVLAEPHARAEELFSMPEQREDKAAHPSAGPARVAA
jgi:hypothetical protein